MAPVDLETLVCGVDRKIACESVIEDNHQPSPDKPEAPTDFPAESFWLRKEDELDWLDRNALYFDEPKESHKGNSNPSSFTSNHNLHSNSSSQRFSFNLTSNTSIIGLPKPKKSSLVGSKSRRCRPPRPRFFPKKQSRSGRSLTMMEPSSPKVSCLGRVMSSKGKNRRSSSVRRATTEVKSKSENKTGFWACLKAILRSSCRNDSDVDIEERQRPKDSPPPLPPRWSFAERGRKIPASAPLEETPGLGGMKRLSSGRRSESWARTDSDFEELVVDSDASDHQHSIWSRRDMDQPKKIDSFHDWKSGGPASA